MSFTPADRFTASSFSIIHRSMMRSDSLPLSEAMDDERVREAFANHNVDFGSDPSTIFNPAITLWALLSQTLFSGEQRSCKAAVLRVASFFASLGRTISTNTGNYCRARTQIPFQAVREIAIRIATDAEATVKRDTVLSAEEAAESLCPPVIGEVKTQSVSGRLVLVVSFRERLKITRKIHRCLSIASSWQGQLTHERLGGW